MIDLRNFAWGTRCEDAIRGAGSPGGGGSGDSAAITMEAVGQEIDKRVNTIISAKFEDFKKTGLAPVIAEHLKPINETLGTVNEGLAKLMAGQGGAPGSGGPGGGGSAGDGKLTPEENAWRKQQAELVNTLKTSVDQLKKEKQDSDLRAEKAERVSTIKTALQPLTFINDSAANTAFTIVEPHVKHLEDGQWVGEMGGDNFPVDTFVKDYLVKDHAYLLRGTGASGSGAPAAGSVQRYGTKVGTEDIKIGMKPETRQAVVEQISAALTSANQ